tara:strand:+ start:54 stop:380 length:327 start_codon:yes stop_codon:yes gene_type:complete
MINKILLLSVLTLFTLPILSQTIFEPDKVTHYFAGSSVSMGTYLVLDGYEIKQNKKIAISISVGILAGILKESHDKSKGGKFDTNDLLATTLGSITVIIPIKLGRRSK